MPCKQLHRTLLSLGKPRCFCAFFLFVCHLAFSACRQFVLFVCLQGKTWVSMFLFFSLHLLHTWSQQMRLLTKPGSGGGHWLLKDSCSIQVFDHICCVIWNLFTWLLDCISLKIMTCAFLCKFTTQSVELTDWVLFVVRNKVKLCFCFFLPRNTRKRLQKELPCKAQEQSHFNLVICHGDTPLSEIRISN